MYEIDRRLNAGFSELRKRGYFAQRGWQCCATCGTAALPSGTTHYAFTHSHSERTLRERGYAHVYWEGDGWSVTKAFLEAGLAVTWDGDPAKAIRVCLPPGG